MFVWQTDKNGERFLALKNEVCLTWKSLISTVHSLFVWQIFVEMSRVFILSDKSGENSSDAHLEKDGKHTAG